MRAAFIDKPLSMVYKTDIEEPQITKDDEVKIQVVVTGICGSEVHAFHGTHPFRIPPVVSGHEFAGNVVEVGKNVTKFKVGDRVTVEPHIGCGKCPQCMSGQYNICPNKKVLGSGGWIGSFGEFIVVPEQTVIKLPDKVTYEEGALIEVLAVGMHAVRMSNLNVGKTCAIIGAGPIGMGTLLAAQLAGASKIFMTDALPFNIEMAKKLGCDVVLNSREQDIRAEILKQTDGEGVDCVFICFGCDSTIMDALTIAKRGGEIHEIALLGKDVTINVSNLQMRELKYIGSNMYTRDDFEAVISAINAGKIDVKPFISKVMPVEECTEAMDIVDKKKEPVIKVMMKF